MGQSSTERAKNGTKRHVIANSRGLPLAAIVTRANKHDLTVALRLVDAIPPIRHGIGKPKKLNDSDQIRKELRRRRIEPAPNRIRKTRGV